MADIIVLSRDHPRIASEFPNELVRSDIKRKNFCGPSLEKTIRKAARGGTYVKANLACDLNAEVLQCAFELKDTSAYILGLSFDSYDRVFSDELSGLGDGCVVHQDLTR
jgi:hypothetical protein